MIRQLLFPMQLNFWASPSSPIATIVLRRFGRDEGNTITVGPLDLERFALEIQEDPKQAPTPTLPDFPTDVPAPEPIDPPAPEPEFPDEEPPEQPGDDPQPRPIP